MNTYVVYANYAPSSTRRNAATGTVKVVVVAETQYAAEQLALTKTGAATVTRVTEVQPGTALVVSQG